MKKQEAFNLVWRAFVTEKKPPSTNSQTCLYNGPKGEHCAAAVVFLADAPDCGEVLSEYEGDSAGDVYNRLTQSHDIRWPDTTVNLLDELQSAHDRAAGDSRRTDTEGHPNFTANIRETLIDLAADHLLTVPAS